MATSLTNSKLRLGLTSKKKKASEQPVHWEEIEEKKLKKRRARSQKDMVRIAREKEERRRLEEEQWLHENANIADVDRNVKRWENTANKLSKLFLRRMVRAYALADASLLSEEALKYGLSIENAKVDHDKMSGFVDRILDLEMLRLLLTDSTLSVTERRRIMRNTIDRTFPNTVVVAKPARPRNIAREFRDTATRISKQAERRLQ